MVEKKERPVRAYDIIDDVGGSNQSAKKSVPSISDLLDRQKEMIARRIEILQGHQIEQDLRRGLYNPPDPNQPQQTGTQGSVMSQIPAEVAIEISKMPDEERSKALDVFQRMAMMEAMKSGNSQAAMMAIPMMIGWGKTDAGKGASLDQMMSFGTNLVAMIKEAGVSKQNNNWGPTDLIGLLQYAEGKKSGSPDILTTFLMDRNRILEDRLHENSGGGGVWDAIMGDDKVFERLKGLGSGNQAQAMNEFGVKTKEIDLQIAKITQDGENQRFQWKQEFDLKNKQWEQDQKTKDAQLAVEKARWDGIQNLGERVAGVIGKAIASGEAETTTQRPQAPPRTQQVEAPQIQAPLPTTKPEPVFMECKVEGCDGKILIRDPTRSASVMCSNGHNLDYTV